MGNQALSIQNLSVRYGSTGAEIKDIHLSLPRGSVLGLVGESGSGKSTICKAILGLLNTSDVELSGRIILDQDDILPLPYDHRKHINGKEIGYIMQNPQTAFNPCMKIKAHFEETLGAHLGCSKRDASLYGAELLSKVGLKEINRVMHSYPHQLSGGMLQRAMTALTVSLKPLFVVADEPTTALDAKNQALVMELLLFIKAEYNPGILLISHDMRIISKMADMIAVMKNGVILEYDSAKKLLNSPEHPYTKELIVGGEYIC